MRPTAAWDEKRLQAFAESRVCSACNTILALEPTTRADGWCPTCQVFRAVPSHERWGKDLKVWLAWQLLERRFAQLRAARPKLTRQECWELVLREIVTGAGEGPTKRAAHGLTASASPLDCYAMACVLTEKARAAAQGAETADPAPTAAEAR
jgi:hypothetical protein